MNELDNVQLLSLLTNKYPRLEWLVEEHRIRINNLRALRLLGSEEELPLYYIYDFELNRMLEGYKISILVNVFGLIEFEGTIEHVIEDFDNWLTFYYDRKQ